MKYLYREVLSFKKLELYGYLLFLSGIFFLPSTLFIGLLLLLPASIFGFFLNQKPYFKDPWNITFFLFGSLILLSALLQNFFLINKYESILDPMLTIIGMGNWLPLIWLFWAFQPYLNTKSKRKTLALTLISGSFPIIATGIGQYFFNWTGPFETLNGLIIWYQRPIESPGGLSGLFNNQNYAGSWLNFVWPFSIALFLEKGNDIFRKAASFIFLFSVGFTAFLTYSRNAWLGLCLSFSVILGKKSLNIFLPIVLIIFLLSSQFLMSDFQNNIKGIIPEKILLEFTDEGYKGLDATRIEIFSSAINLIKINPIFGIGSGSFTPIFLSETNFWKGHSHNLFLELSLSYGLPASLIFFGSLIIILILSGKKLFINNKIFDISRYDVACWAALFYFMISQCFDVQYFDGKISIVVWILIASLKNIIEENKPKN